MKDKHAMKMGWQPTQDGLDQILLLLRQSQSTDIQTQNHVQQRLEDLNQFREFNNYLVFVLTKMKTEGISTLFFITFFIYTYILYHSF